MTRTISLKTNGTKASEEAKHIVINKCHENGFNVKEVKTPDIRNITLEEAILLAKEHGFVINEDTIRYEISDEYEEGKIMEQDPKANIAVKDRKDKKIINIIIMNMLNDY